AKYKADADTARKMLKDVRDLLDRVQGEFARSESEKQELASMEAEEDGKSKQWQEVSKDLSSMEIVATQNEFANIDWARYPSIPDIPSFPKLSITLTVAIMLGLALS